MNTIYAEGGYDSSKPFGNATEQWDDDTRTYTDYRSGVAVTRAYTTQEAADADARVAALTTTTTESAIRTKALQALTANATFLAIASPTTAQTAAQVKALTRQVSALIRLTTRQLLDTSGT